MDTDLPEFLGGEPAPAPQPEPEAPETPTTPPESPTEGQPRGPDGKFAPAAPEPAPAAEPAPAEPVVEAQAHTVPLATFLDLRDKATAAEKRAADLEKWRADQEAQARRQPVPDRTTDPEAYQEHFEATTRQTLDMIALENRREISRMRAEQAHGKDAVDAAFEWAASRIDEDLARGQPSYLNQQVARHADPIGFVVGEWRKDQIASKVDPNDYDNYLAWKASQPGAQPGSPTPPQRPVAPRPSLAGASSAGAHSSPEARDGEATFNAMFGT